MKRILCLLLACLCLHGCGSNMKESESEKQDPPQQTADEKGAMKLKINGIELEVEWEDNPSVEALKDLSKDKALLIVLSGYGGFEQIGSIGSSIVRDDRQMTAVAGDIMLYSGNSIVVFYGSNEWSYTPLGRIRGKSDSELKELLGVPSVTLELVCE